MKIVDVLENMLCFYDVEIASSKFDKQELKNLEEFNKTQTLKQRLENIMPEPKIEFKHKDNGYEVFVGTSHHILDFVRKYMPTYEYESILVDEEGNVRFYLD